MRDQFTLKLNSPITEEQWDAITDVDFDHTEEIFFHTKHGKEVTFVKQKKGRWIYRPEIGWGDAWVCSECEEITKSTIMGKPRYNFCPMCGARMEGIDETD